MPTHTAGSGSAATTVAVVDPVPGAPVLTDAGFGVADPFDVAGWVDEATNPAVVIPAVVITFRTAEEFALAGRLHAADNAVPMVGLVTADCPGAYQQALQAGVCAAACADAPSVVALTDAAGDAVNRYAYTPYGQLTQTDETASNPWRFTGEYQDATRGLYKIGHRYYDPDLSRWTQPDPSLPAPTRPIPERPTRTPTSPATPPI